MSARVGWLHVTRVGGFLLANVFALACFLVVFAVAGPRSSTFTDLEPWLAVVAILPALMIATATFAIQARFVGPLGALLWSALLALLVAAFYQLPIVAGDQVKSGAAAPLHVARLSACLAPLLLGTVLAMIWRGRESRARADALACGAIAMGIVAVALAVPRWSRPAPFRYLDTLQRVTGPVEQGRPFHIGAGEYRLMSVPPSPMCGLVGPRWTMQIGVPLDQQYAEVSCLPVLLRVDPRGDYAVLYSSCPDLCAYLPSSFSPLDIRPADEEIAALAGSAGGQRFPYGLAFRLEDGAHVGLTVALVSDRVSAPRSFLFVAIGGAVSAAALLVLAAVTRRRSHLAEIADALQASAFVAALVLATPLVAAHALGL